MKFLSMIRFLISIIIYNMVKLIRLVTSDNTGLFSNEFTSDINIPVGSKICLANLSLEGAETEIIIDESNDTIVVQYSDFVTKTAYLEHGTFKQSQLDDLILNIQTSLNNSVGDEAVCIGQQFKVNHGNNKKIQIQKTQAFLNEHTSSWTLDNVVKTSVINGNVWSSNLDTNTTENTNAMWSDLEWCKGGAVFTCRIDTLIYDETSAGDDFNGFTLGLCRVKPSTLNPIDRTNIDFGIRCIGEGLNYEFYSGGVLEESDVEVNYEGITSTENDILQISISDGFLKLFVYQYDEEPRLLHEIDLNGYYGTPISDLVLYPFISFQGKNTNAKVFQVRYTADPFITPSFFQPDYTPALNSVRLPSQQVERTNQSLTWGGLSLANFLGFLNVRYPSVGNTFTKNIIYTADTQFILKNVSDSLVVELLNINLASFDGITKQRRNFISVIPAQSNLVEGKVIYEASNLIYLDIDNSTPSQLRNIRGRILKSDLSPVTTSGNTVITLLIKNGNE